VAWWLCVSSRSRTVCILSKRPCECVNDCFYFRETRVAASCFLAFICLSLNFTYVLHPSLTTNPISIMPANGSEKLVKRGSQCHKMHRQRAARRAPGSGPPKASKQVKREVLGELRARHHGVENGVVRLSKTNSPCDVVCKASVRRGNSKAFIHLPSRMDDAFRPVP
jgi:hypothetical protein